MILNPDPKIGELACAWSARLSVSPGEIGAGVSGGWFEGDLVAEGFELADVGAFALFRVHAGGVEVAAEVVVAGAGVGE